MNSPSNPFAGQTEAQQNQLIQRYYRLQSKIYDATRWSFLFGRKQIIREIPLPDEGSWRILEIGFGTGYNLRRLARRFSKAQFFGLDVSEDMQKLATKNLKKFANRVTLEARPYQFGATEWTDQFDAVLFSYSLTMINPQWPELIQQAKNDLKPGGFIAVTDFHHSPFLWFRQHMAANHVRMEGHLLPVLEEHFQPVVAEVKAAYNGIWQYLVFVGRKL